MDVHSWNGMEMKQDDVSVEIAHPREIPTIHKEARAARNKSKSSHVVRQVAFSYRHTLLHFGAKGLILDSSSLCLNTLCPVHGLLELSHLRNLKILQSFVTFRVHDWDLSYCLS